MNKRRMKQMSHLKNRVLSFFSNAPSQELTTEKIGGVNL